MQIPLTITRPLGLTKAASVAEITAAIEQHNKVFDDVCRMLRSTSEGTADKKQVLQMGTKMTAMVFKSVKTDRG